MPCTPTPPLPGGGHVAGASPSPASDVLERGCTSEGLVMQQLEPARRCTAQRGPETAQAAMLSCPHDGKQVPRVQDFLLMELAGLEPATSWVRSRRSPS